MHTSTVKTIQAAIWLIIGLAFCALPGYAQIISGTVYRDFNSNGSYEALPASGTYAYGEPGTAGVKVTAYSSNSATAPVSATTDATGFYTLTVGSSAQFRLEFTNLMGGDFDAFRGTASATSVQFVNGGSTNVDFGVNYPANYCERLDPQLVTTCFVAINATDSPPLGTRDALVGVPYNVVDNAKTVSHYATVNDIGAAWGLAYKKDTKQLFTAAFTKRHVGFAHGGPNAIYVTDFSSATATTSEFFNFTTVGGGAVSTTAETHGNDIPTSVNANGKLDSYDIPAFDAVGKTSLGDIDMSDDDKTLYVVNLKDRKLYLIDVATKVATGFAIPNPCGGQSYRPFALKYYRGKTYVGVVCTREDLNLDANNDGKPDTYTSTAGLSATVFEFNGSTFTDVLSFPLTYKKQATNADQAGQARAEYWRPWATTYQTDRTDTSYPEAWLTDIEFDVDGDMIVGIRDRFGDQTGYQNRRPIAGDGAFISGISPGEILRARKCSPTATTWTLESNGALCATTPSAQQDAQQGPGGGKYYWGDRVQNGGNHGASSMAGLALLAGSGKLAMTAIDSQDDFFTGGIKRMINETGAKDGNATGGAYNPGSGAKLYGSDAFGYGKANGLGDLEVLCARAPIQIGNRVWVDANNNGVQDPGEAVLAGLTVVLKGPGLPAAGVSVTTDAKGEYYFANATGTNATGYVYSLTGLVSGGAYTLTFPTSASAGTLSLSSKPNSATGTNADAIDTDPNPAGVVSFTLGQAGENNFTYDAAFVASASLGDYVFIDANRDGIQNMGDNPLAGVVVTLYLNGSAVATTTTTGTGFYSFTGLTPGGNSSYVVGFTPPAGYTATLTNAPGSTTANDSDLIGATGKTASLTLSPGESNTTVDAGFYLIPASLGDYVFEDVNRDGIQNTGDLPISGAVVTLLQNGSAVATTTTNGSGLYSFTGLTPGIPYSVSFTTPAGFSATTLPNVGDDALDSDPVNGVTGSYTLTPGQNNTTVDAGFVRPLPTYALAKTVNLKQIERGQFVTYTVSLTNTSGATATSLTLTDQLSSSAVTLVGSATTSTGTFAPGSSGGVWTIPSLTGGQVATLTLKVQLNEEGIIYNTVTLPGQQTATTCVSVPAHVCANESFQFDLTAPASYSTYQWSRNGTPIAGATSSTYSVTAVGEYTVAATSLGGCPDGSCCPFIVVADPAPSLTALAVSAQCVGQTPQANGAITLVGSSTGAVSYNLTKGSSFTANAPLFATPQNLSAVVGGVLIGGQPNPAAAQDYTIRVYSANGCFSDTVVTIQPTVCACPPAACAPFIVRKTKAQGKLIAP